MGARIVSKELKILALSIFIFIIVLALMPEVFANSVTLSADQPYQISDGYSTSIVTATVDSAGPGENVDFTINGVYAGSATTDNGGMASLQIGPYPYGVPAVDNIVASCEGSSSDILTVTFLSKSNLKLLIDDPSVPVGSNVTVKAVWTLDSINPAVNVPLTITALDPNFNIISSELITTDSSGTASMSFDISSTAGYNWIIVSLDSVTLKSKYILGTGGDITHLVLSTNPASPIFADGKTSYILHVKALDVGDNAVAGKNITIYKDGQRYETYPTNSNGYVSVNLGPSSYVMDMNITAFADDTLATGSINLSYIRGFASNISIAANPPVVANANISTVPGQADVHTTDIIATLTDYWGHPVSGQTVSIASMNTTLGNIYLNNSMVSVATGVTSDSGQFVAQFVLGNDVNYSDIDVGAPIMTWYNNSTTGVYTSAIYNVRYTDKPFVVATTQYSPQSNLSINDTIDVTINLRACGWVNMTNYNNSAVLLFDTSGSMDWLANTIYPLDGKPKIDTIPAATQTVYNGWYGVDPADWQYIDQYTYSGSGNEDLQIMLSSDYRYYRTDGTGTFYYLKVVDPNGVSYNTANGGYTGGNVVAQNASNENFIKFTNATSGTYTIYGAYIRNPSIGDTPYNMMVLTDPKRLGQGTGVDQGSAAKVAGTQFVSLMNKNQVGVVWFNDSYPISPVAKFSANPLAGNAPLSVQFTDLSDNSPSSWSWNFGDLSTSNAQNPQHTYVTAGTYSVQLKVTNTGGSNTALYTNYITVHHAAPIPNFMGTPTSGYVPLTVQFTDTSGDSSVTAWSWTFGDGGTSTAQNPSYTYSATGTYTVSLKETNDGGSNTVTKTNYISVVPHSAPPVADFTASPTSAKVQTTVTFTDKSTGSNINTWSWTFGDGGTSTAKNPTHKYAAAGTYTVTLTVTNDGGSNMKTKTSYITITNNAPPVADFTGTPTSGNAPLTVTFTDKSTGSNLLTWQWNYGDGSANGTTKNPSHKYTAAGTYTVTLTVTNDGGSSTVQKIGYITVNPAVTATPTATATATATATPQPPVPDFTGTPTSGYVALSVTFTDKSTNAPTSWSWTFGDGGTSNSKNPVHVYNAVGTYTVTLKATNSAGSNTITKTNYITVIAHNAVPVADFTGTPTSGNEPLTVQFTDTSTGNNIYGWSWTFGDGGTSTAQNPSYTYATAGTYTVTLKATNDGGSNTKTKTGYIIVSHNAPPVASFIESPTSGNVPLTVTFTDTSTGSNLNSWSWTFGDGQTSTQRNPIITYSTAGTYVVTLTVTNDGGSNSAQNNVVVIHNALPVADFTGTPTSGYVPLTVQFTDASTGSNIISWQWNFGDGSSNSTVKNPSHIYTSQGVYTVTLTVTNDDGSSTVTKKYYITAMNSIPTAPPMLAGILANFLNLFSPGANAAGVTPMTNPAGTAMGLTVVNAVTMGPLNHSIDSLSSFGGTNIGAGIAQSIQEFNTNNYTAGNKKYIVLLTDGYSQYPDFDIDEAKLAASQNITIYTVGIGMPDDDTLQNIADITGGQYTKVSSLPDLVNTFSAIANKMTDVAGYNISLCTFTNYSNSISPDALYVPNSSMIIKPNGQQNQTEPTIIRDDVNNIYELTWGNLGNLSYNQNLTIKYQLIVKAPGNITPITKDSYVGFWTNEGNTSNTELVFQHSGFGGQSLYVNNTTNNPPDVAPPDLTVAITAPDNNSTVQSQRLMISWDTIYSGTDTYNQMVKVNDVPLLPTPASSYASSVSQPWQYTWDLTNMASGNYNISVYAYDSYCSSIAYVNVTIDHSSGKIKLE